MPRTTVYIRNQDMEAWRAIENKSAFISAALQGSEKLQKLAQDMTNLHKNMEHDRVRLGMAPTPAELREMPAQTLKNLCKVHGIDKEACKLMKH